MLTTSIALALLHAALPVARDQKPNFVLVMADDQGWGDVGYNGHPTLKTPNLDQLAATGLRFDRFYAAHPVCSPTRGSVMTGRNPNRFACFSWGHPLRPQEITIAEALKRAGYRTGHFGKWHLGSVRKGSPVNPGASGFDEWLSAPNFFDNDPILSREGKAVQTKGESSIVTADAAIEFIRKCKHANQKFLAVVWFGSPHAPHRASEEDKKLYSDQPPRMQNFLGEITGLDRAVGKLRRELDTLGLRENTLFWYCSDNGALGIGSSGGRRGKKGQIYDGGLMVPAVLEWPARLATHKTTKLRCSTSDIFPTLLDIAGVEREDDRPLDGISLLPLIDGDLAERPGIGFWTMPVRGISTPSKKWMTELLAAQAKGTEPDDPVRVRLDAAEIKPRDKNRRLVGHSAWIEGDWKLHRIKKRKQKQVRWELYNLAEDPNETTNLVDEQPERVAKMKRALLAWQRSVLGSLHGDDY